MSTSIPEWISHWVRLRRRESTLELSPDTDLYKSGLLDSLGIIELIEALEDEYRIQFTEEEMQSGLTRIKDFDDIIHSRQ
jgi:acyl carrier protein